MAETNAEPTLGLPTRAPGDFASLAARTASTAGELAIAAEKARRAPGAWHFVGYTNADRSNHTSWAAAVRDGKKVSLGELTEQWDADVVRGYHDDNGYFVGVGHDQWPGSGRRVVHAKYIAYLGPRANNGEVR